LVFARLANVEAALQRHPFMGAKETSAGRAACRRSCSRGATRIWAQAALAKSTFEQKSYLDAYFDKHDASNADRLTSAENDEAKPLA